METQHDKFHAKNVKNMKNICAIYVNVFFMCAGRSVPDSDSILLQKYWIGFVSSIFIRIVNKRQCSWCLFWYTTENVKLSQYFKAANGKLIEIILTVANQTTSI